MFPESPSLFHYTKYSTLFYFWVVVKDQFNHRRTWKWIAGYPDSDWCPTSPSWKGMQYRREGTALGGYWESCHALLVWVFYLGLKMAKQWKWGLLKVINQTNITISIILICNNNNSFLHSSDSWFQSTLQKKSVSCSPPTNGETEAIWVTRYLSSDILILIRINNKIIFNE